MWEFMYWRVWRCAFTLAACGRPSLLLKQTLSRHHTLAAAHRIRASPAPTLDRSGDVSGSESLIVRRCYFRWMFLIICCIIGCEKGRTKNI